MTKPKHIEGIKTILIIALFLSTMLLLYFNWENPIASTFRLPQIIADETGEEGPKVRDVVLPNNIDVNLGSGIYTKLEETQFDAWNECIRALTLHSQGENVFVEEITYEQYVKIMEFRSIRYSFDYELPFNEFCKQYDILLAQGYSQINTFREISYSAGSPESLFVADRMKNKYYRIVSDKKLASFDDFITIIENGDYNASYPMGTFVGTGSRILLPLPYESGLTRISFVSEYSKMGAEGIREFAQTFFGESFDFVRRIEESKGTVIYMYGYGEKVLTINPAGSIEYKDKAAISGTRQEYFEALQTALNFVTSHGTFHTMDAVQEPYLKDSSVIVRDKKEGYLFVFGFKNGDESIYYEGGEAIRLEIVGGQITHYTRDMIHLPEEDEDETGKDMREVYSAVNMLAQNFLHISTVLTAEGYPVQPAKGELLFDSISNQIQQVKTGYVRPAATGFERESATKTQNELIPAWIVVMDQITFYFDLFNAEPLGYNKSAE